MTASVTECQNRITYHLRDLSLYLYCDTKESSKSMPPIHLLYSETIKGLSNSMNSFWPLSRRLALSIGVAQTYVDMRVRAPVSNQRKQLIFQLLSTLKSTDPRPFFLRLALRVAV